MPKKLREASKKAETELREEVLTPVRAPEPAAPAEPAGYQRIELEYPVHPRPRWLKFGPAGERLIAKLASSIPEARALIGEIAGFSDEFLAIPARAPVMEVAAEDVGKKGLGRPVAEGRPGKVLVEVNPAEPSWANGWFPAFDAAMLYGLLALRNPRWYVEVGSGNSTRFARRAIRDHGLRTRIISIDPCPRAEIDAICDTVLRAPLEDLDLTTMEPLTKEDLLFVDSSHRSFQNSDVTVFFTEILPRLPVGIVYGLHDIYLPWDYPDEWRHRFYNEQYLLAAYLLGGANGDEIISPNAFLSLHSPQLLESLAGVFNSAKLHGIERTGGAFWMRRRAPQT
jgi:hypothetical protein